VLSLVYLFKMSGLFIVAAKRTPFGAFGGALKAVTATELGVVSTKAALAQANLDPALVDQVYFGNVIASSNDAAYLARHVGLQSGLPVGTPALTINRLCGSGFETVIQGAKSILTGEAQIAVCGGTENMSMAPLQANGLHARWGVPLGKGLQMEDALWSGLTDSYAKTPMGVTAENLAKQYNISRQECDEFAIRSQQLWGKAHEAGVFAAELAAVEVKGKKGPAMFETDEHPRPDSTLEKIGKLPPVFDKDQGVVTAANASGICDGAGTVILASEQAVKQHNLTPLCRLVSYGVTGCEPKIMGIGPVEAIRRALHNADMNLGQVDRVEINEAFAAQFLACAKELELDMGKTNIHGGAISLGHPLGASGSRITAHLANEFAASSSKIHVGAACIGGGQGIALVMERA
jgi:acetyl-CoA acyltransferase 2